MTTPTWQALNDYLERERQWRKESIRGFATILGVHHVTYLAWIRGRREPSLEALELISVALERPLADILNLAGHNDPHLSASGRDALLAGANQPPLGLSEEELTDLRQLPREEQDRLLGTLRRALDQWRRRARASAHDDAQD